MYFRGVFLQKLKDMKKLIIPVLLCLGLVACNNKAKTPAVECEEAQTECVKECPAPCPCADSAVCAKMECGEDCICHKPCKAECPKCTCTDKAACETKACAEDCICHKPCNELKCEKKCEKACEKKCDKPCEKKCEEAK